MLWMYAFHFNLEPNVFEQLFRIWLTLVFIFNNNLYKAINDSYNQISFTHIYVLYKNIMCIYIFALLP